MARMSADSAIRKTLVTLEEAQWEYLRRVAFARRSNVSAVVRELVAEAMNQDRWPEVRKVQR